MRAIQSDWAFCLPRYGAGFFDPPRTLGHGQHLVPTTIPSSTKDIAWASPTPGSGPPKIPAATASQAANPMTSIAYIAKPIPSLTPLLLPIEVTVRPASTLNEREVIVALSPTWISAVSRYAGKSVEGISSDSPASIRSVEAKSEYNTKQGTTNSPWFSDSIDGTPAVIVGTQTLLPGRGITISGTTSIMANLHTTIMGGIYLFLDPESMQVVIDGYSTVHLSSTMAALQAQLSPFVLKLDGRTYIADSLGRFTVDAQILTPGGTIMVSQRTTTLPNGQITRNSGTLVYLDPHGRTVVVDGQTLSALERAQLSGSSKLTVVLGKTYSVPLSGAATIMVGGVTLNMPGGGVTVVGGRTIVLPDAHAPMTKDTTLSSPAVNGDLKHSLSSILSSSMAAQSNAVSSTLANQNLGALSKGQTLTCSVPWTLIGLAILLTI